MRPAPLPPGPAPVAFVCNQMPPYRVHVHERIARELPQIRLWSISTHSGGDGRWRPTLPREIGPVEFGPNDETEQQGALRFAMREWRKGGRIISWLKQHQIRAVVVHGYNDLGRLRIIGWCRAHRVPCVLTADSNIAGDNARGIRRLLKRAVVGWVVRRCNAVLPFGRMGRAFFQRYGARSEQIFLFPVEPDYGLIERLPDALIAETRARFGLAANRKRVIYSGRLIPVKRVDLLLDAFGRTAAERPDWDLVIVGDGPLRAQLESSVRPALRSRVLWTGFVGDQAVVSALYRCADVLALPSDYEPWALVVNEAAAACLAIVCSNVVGAAPELVRDGVNGRLFPPGDRDAMAACLLAVTAPGAERMKSSSPQVLAEWRQRADPVRGIFRALEYCGVV